MDTIRKVIFEDDFDTDHIKFIELNEDIQNSIEHNES